MAGRGEYEALERSISERSDDELLRMVASEQADYRLEAVQIARDEIRRRGLVELSREEYEAQVAPGSIVDERPFPKVLFARRLNADTTDGVIAAALMLVPMFLIGRLAESLPAGLERLGILGIPVGLFYAIFRDAVGRGTSPGKRMLGLHLVDLRTGNLCSAARVWRRNLTDLVPVLNLIDFILMCIDPRGQKMMDKKLQVQLVDTRRSGRP